MTAPAIDRHPARDCPCREQLELTLEQLAGIYDGDYSEVDVEPDPAPLTRTETACQVTGCPCVEFAEGLRIDGWLHCGGGCKHTRQMHKQPKPAETRKAARR